MLEWFLLIVGLVGFAFASYWDLKTTEFPDWLPYLMILVAVIIQSLRSVFERNPEYLISSLLTGSVFLGIGLGLYHLKQWGDGDAWLLGVLGFLFPESPWIRTALPFPVVMIFNFFLISFFYLIFYSLALGLVHPEIIKDFTGELKKQKNKLFFFAGFFVFLACIFAGYMSYLGADFKRIVPLFLLAFIFILVMVFVHYGKFVEDNLFKKKIHVKNLKPGDVLMERKWKGLTEEEIKKLKKERKYVWIKEGVRFAPVFLITMVVSLFYGNMLVIFLGF